MKETNESLEKINKNISTGSTLQKVLRHGSVYLFVSFLGKGIGILMLPVYTRLLSPEDYGHLSTIMSIGSVVGIFMSLQVDAAYSRLFFEYNKDLNKLKTLLSTCFWFTLGWGFFVYLMSIWYIYLFSYQLNFSGLFFLVVIGVLSPLFSKIGLIGVLFFKQTHQSKIFATGQIMVLVIAHTLSIILLLNTELKAAARLIPDLIATITVAFYYTTLNQKKGLLGFTFDVDVLKKLLTYGLAILPGVAASWIYGLSDRILLSSLRTFQETGIYSVGYELGRIIPMVNLAIFMAYKPIMFSKLTENFTQGLKSLAKPFTALYFSHGLIAILVVIFSKDIVSLFTDKEFHSASGILAIITVSFFIASQTAIYQNILEFKKKILTLSGIVAISGFANLALNLIFIPKYGMYAAAYTTLAAFSINTTLIIYIARREAKPQLDYRSLAKVTLIFLTIIGFYLFCSKIDFAYATLTAKLLIIPLTILLTIKLSIFDNLTSLYKRKRDRPL
jgi:O-antigen/teichoic acid export membrane protein